MEASELWELLRQRLPDEVARVASQCGPITGSTQDLLELLDDRYSSASIADDKSGVTGNSYEHVRLDFFRLVQAARELSGQKGRPRWERR